MKAYVTVCRESAIKAAETVSNQIKAGQHLGALQGIPISVKDLFDVQDLPTTCGSKLMNGYCAQRDCTAVQKLKEAGAIILGKVRTHEFAYGGVTPPTRNPWDLSRIPGGSSGGSAAAVSIASALVAIGSDTVGSIRIPSSLCGVVGLKPTYGRVSRKGVFPLSWSLDHMGPITKRVEDAALLLSVMAGFDAGDPTSSSKPVPNYLETFREESKRPTIGVPRNYFFEPCDPEVAEAVRDAIEVLRDLGCETIEFEFPDIPEIGAAANIILSAEASTYHRHSLAERADDFSPQVRVLLEQGLFLPATDYIQALRFRSVAYSKILALFKHFDVMVTPTLPFTAPRVGEMIVKFAGIEEDYEVANTRYLAPFNLTGLPALSLPCGFSRNGLPIGMQLVGKPFDESTVLKLGYMYECATEWHLRYPDVNQD